MTVVFPHPLFPITIPRTFRGTKIKTVTTTVVTGLPGIMFADVHSCSTSASGIHELDELL